MNHKSYEQSNSYERDDSKTNDSDNKNDNNYSRSENEHNYGHWKYEENNSGKKSSSKYAKARAARVKARLEKYQITANDAEIIFGKNWEEKLGKPEVDFYFMVMKIAIKIQFDFSGRYKRKYGKLYDKVLKIIDILIEENPEMDGGYDKNYKEKFKEEFRKQNGDKRYGDQWNYDDWFNEDNQDKDYSHNRNYGFGNQSQYSNKAIENAYSEMELKQDATDAEIKSKYRELILKYHPDRNKGSTYATEKTVKINLAFEIIMGVRKSA